MILTVVCDVLGKENNGTTIATINLIRSMREKGHTVRVVCPDKFRSGEENYHIVNSLNLGKVLNNYLMKNGVLVAKWDRATLEKAFEGTDAVHILTPFFLSAQAAKICKEKNIPLTAGFHCQAENVTNHFFLMNSDLSNKAVYKIFYKYVYQYVDCIHFPTQFICDVFENEIKRTVNHRVISNGVNKAFVPIDTPKPNKFKNKFVILFTGRYSREKSHKLLIDAVEKSKYSDKIQLIFAGCGPREKELKEYALKLKNKPYFKFFLRNEMLDVLNYSDLYVHPAEIEIEAIACLEAISCGLVPVINNSPRSATRYFAKGENNLFDFNSSDDLCKKIDWWIEHPEEKEKCRDEYLGYAKQFDFDFCMNEMEKMIVENAEKHNEVR